MISLESAYFFTLHADGENAMQRILYFGKKSELNGYPDKYKYRTEKKYNTDKGFAEYRIAKGECDHDSDITSQK